MKELKKMGLLLLGGFLISSNVLAAGVSKSKTATSLNEDNISKVTLSLPSDEEKLVSDVVFVIDSSSCGGDAWDKATSMMETLAKDVEKSDGALKVGAVIFRGYAFKYDLKATTKDNIKSVMEDIHTYGEDTEKYVSKSENKNTMKGSNMHAGLLAANEMLSSDNDVPNSRKYVIVISDGITYTWLEDGKQMGVNFRNEDGDTPMIASNSAYEVTHREEGRSWHPDDWAKYLTDNKEDIQALAKEYSVEYNRDTTVYYKEKSASKDEKFTTVDVALLKSYEAYKELNSKYHAYSIALENDQYGYSFMNMLNDNASTEEVLKNIKYDVYYVVSKGTIVTDYIGYGDNYDFDFVNEESSLTLKVGNIEYKATKVDENIYAFDDGLYTLTYTKGDKGEEKFVWYIGENISNFERVSLTYEVQLMEAPTETGTYNLETNYKATIVPVDSNNEKGKTEEFEIPTVEFVVKDATGEDEPEEEQNEEKINKKENNSKKEEYQKPEVYTGVSSTIKTASIVLATIGLISASGLFIFKRLKK